MRGLWRLRKLYSPLLERWRRHRAMRMVAAFPRIRDKQPHGLPGDLIVSLTSYPPRFPTLAFAIKSLLDQRVAADRTILWVATEDRAGLPNDVLRLVGFGLEIRDCPDLRSYKKLVPSLRTFPQAYIVTADDDLYYRPDWLEQLVAASKEWPDRIIAHRGHMSVRNEGGGFSPYATWEFETADVLDRSPSALLFPTTGSGMVYPPGSLHPRVADEDTFMRLCPNADDVWFFWMARLAGSKIRRVTARLPLVNWSGSQDVALYLDNLNGGHNDVQIAAMEKHFGPALPSAPNHVVDLPPSGKA